MASQGAFTFVLHSHLPYARMAGRWPHGEEWIHEAASETYIPLLNALYELRAEGVKFKLTIGITPVLAEQLADADVCDHFDAYLDEKIARAKKDVLRFRGVLWEEEQAALKAKATSREDAEESKLPKVDKKAVEKKLKESNAGKAQAAVATTEEKPWWVGHQHLEFLASFYQQYYEKIKKSFDNAYKRDMIGAFKKLQDEGYIEIITCAATHGYLPLLGYDTSIRGQLRAGVASYERLFGRKPRSIWLPECAYRPAYYEEDGTLRPGIEHFLSEIGIKLFFSETHLIEGGAPVGVAAGEVMGPYGEIKRRYLVPMTSAPSQGFETSTFNAYYVSDTTHGANAEDHSGVAIIGRNNETGQRVWSADWGYPGDFDYREFHRKDGESGLQYWRVTGARVDLGSKDFYHPDWANNKMRLHAQDFVGLVERIHQARHDNGLGYGLTSSNYDTELFGHWWFEGVDWLKHVLRGLAASPTIDLVTASEYIEQQPPHQVLHVPEGSWGAGGTHFTWDNVETHWMWQPIYEAESRFQHLADRHNGDWGDENLRGVLNQAARELLLAESSDWPFLVTTGQARDYAIQRFQEHLERFQALASSIEAGMPDSALSARLWERDRLFENVDYRWWCSH